MTMTGEVFEAAPRLGTFKTWRQCLLVTSAGGGRTLLRTCSLLLAQCLATPEESRTQFLKNAANRSRAFQFLNEALGFFFFFF